MVDHSPRILTSEVKATTTKDHLSHEINFIFSREINFILSREINFILSHEMA